MWMRTVFSFGADPDLSFHFGADPGPSFHFSACRDPSLYLFADPDPPLNFDGSGSVFHVDGFRSRLFI